MKYPLDYYFKEGFVVLHYWRNLDPVTKDAHSFDGAYIHNKNTPVVAGTREIDSSCVWTITIGGETYKLDENFFLDYGIFFSAEADGQRQLDMLTGEQVEIAAQVEALLPQLADAEL